LAKYYLRILLFLVTTVISFSGLSQEEHSLSILYSIPIDSIEITPPYLLKEKKDLINYTITNEAYCVTVFSSDKEIKKCFTPPFEKIVFYDPQFEIQELEIVNVVQKNIYKENKLNISNQIESISIGGENDPIINSASLPGIQSAGEFQQGLFVRGSSSDKNKFLLDNAIVYAPFHQFGLFSVFNDNIIKSATISTSGFDANYGGRTASFMDVKTKTFIKDTSDKSISVGLLSSNLFYHKKINSKSNILTSIRGTYGNFLAQPFLSEDFEMYFYDGSVKYNCMPNDSVIWSIGSHFSIDKNNFRIPDALHKQLSKVSWGNWTNIINYKRFLKNGKSIETHLSNSNLKLENKNEIFGSDWGYSLSLISSINDMNHKFIFNSRDFRIGVDQTLHLLSPEFIYKTDGVITNSVIEPQKTYENGSFFQYGFSRRFIDFKTGLRVNLYWNDDLFHSVSPRLNIKLRINRTNELKLTYDETSQFLYSLTSNGIGLPTDIWLTTGENTPIQKSRQYCINYKYDTDKMILSGSLFHKEEEGAILYKPGNSFALSSQGADFIDEGTSFSDRIIRGVQKSQGVELLVELNQKKSRQTVSYTYSLTQAQFDNTNLGKWFDANQNRPHKLNINSQISIWKKWIFIANCNINSGRNATEHSSIYNYNGVGTSYSLTTQRIESINNFKYPLYHRLDIMFSQEKQREKVKFEKSFGIINVYNKRNVNFYFTEDNSYKSVALLPFFPTANFKWSW